jgi:hypothetical protein
VPRLIAWTPCGLCVCVVCVCVCVCVVCVCVSTNSYRGPAKHYPEAKLLTCFSLHIRLSYIRTQGYAWLRSALSVFESRISSFANTSRLTHKARQALFSAVRGSFSEQSGRNLKHIVTALLGGISSSSRVKNGRLFVFALSVCLHKWCLDTGTSVSCILYPHRIAWPVAVDMVTERGWSDSGAKVRE